MILITGDTHGDFRRLYSASLFPADYAPSRADFLIICGDFGGLWYDSPQERASLDQLESLPYTVLFVDGNHENFDLFERYPLQRWNGGSARMIRKNLIYLARGQIFTLDGQSFFTMGGAQSRDITDGVLDPDVPDFDTIYREMRQAGKRFRVLDYSWWARELPAKAELAAGWRALQRRGFAVDYILTHCAPTNVQMEICALFGGEAYPVNQLTDFLQRVYESCTYKHWFCGHYHAALDLGRNFCVLNERVIVLPDYRLTDSFNGETVECR